MSWLRVRNTCAVVVCGAVFTGTASLIAGTTAAADSANPHAPAATAAATWQSGQLVDNAVNNFGMPDWGLTIDTLFALSATGAKPEVRDAVAANVAAHVRSYNSYDDWEIPDVRIAGATAKLLVAAIAAGKDPGNFGGHDMRQETLALIAGADAGDNEGRLRDKPAAGESDNSNTFGQSLAVIGLARSGEVPKSAVDFLIRQQCSEGGFRLSPDAFGTPAPTCDAAASPVLDPDSTGMAVQALLAAAEDDVPGAAEAAEKGADWLESIQRPDGSFGGSGPTANSNTNSTGLAGQALGAAGHKAAADKAAAWVAGLQLTAQNGGAAAKDAGAIAYNGESLAAAQAEGITELSGDQWRRATPQALLALAGVPLGDLGKVVTPPTSVPPTSGPPTSQPPTTSGPPTSRPPTTSGEPTTGQPTTGQPTTTQPTTGQPTGTATGTATATVSGSASRTATTNAGSIGGGTSGSGSTGGTSHGTGGGALASTGAQVGALGIGALALVVGGFAAMRVARRKPEAGQ